MTNLLFLLLVPSERRDLSEQISQIVFGLYTQITKKHKTHKTTKRKDNFSYEVATE